MAEQHRLSKLIGPSLDGLIVRIAFSGYLKYYPSPRAKLFGQMHLPVFMTSHRAFLLLFSCLLIVLWPTPPSILAEDNCASLINIGEYEYDSINGGILRRAFAHEGAKPLILPI